MLKLTEFFIKNNKLTTIIVGIIFALGIASYFTLPKQYNPKITVPAFSIMVPAPGLSSQEVSNLVVAPLENKLMEIEGIDEMMGVASENMAGVMTTFVIGTDKEEAKTRLYEKINNNMDLKPLGVQNPIIKTIDPDDLAQIVLAVTYNSNQVVIEGNVVEEDVINKDVAMQRLYGVGDQYVYLRQVANLLKKDLKQVEDTAILEIVGGYKNNVYIDLDLSALESTQTDINFIKQALDNNNFSLPVGEIDLSNQQKIVVDLDGQAIEIDKFKRIVISPPGSPIVYLEEVAEIYPGVKKVEQYSLYNNQPAVFLGISKTASSNSVDVTEAVLEKLAKIERNFPQNIEVKIIQNEGVTAKEATNMLLTNLAQSILIVFIILALALGVRNALNSAITIPLTLSFVFFIALLAGENINRITLFALILSLGMLVDDSTVVVENINRHLQNRFKMGKTKLEAILAAIKEVYSSVILSTVTRFMSFGAMFFVTDMMGEYMGPIPKFMLVTLFTSTFVALVFNPWISFNFYRDVSEKQKDDNKIKLFLNDLAIKLKQNYVALLDYFIAPGEVFVRRRKWLKRGFWLSLLIVIFLPIQLGVFKARMLPKSDQNQVYLWIDTPRSYQAEELRAVQTDLNNFLLEQLPPNLQQIENISTTINLAFPSDFANLFRGSMMRQNSYQLSSRLNLVDKQQRNISSEQWVIAMRPLLRDFLLAKFPDLKIRILEDPPGPPVQATFLAKIKGESSLTEQQLTNFLQFVKWEINKIAALEEVADLVDTTSTTYSKLNLQVDHTAVARAGLTLAELTSSLNIALQGVEVSLLHSSEMLEATNLILGVKKDQQETIRIIDKLFINNWQGQKIPLTELVTVENSFVGSDLFSDQREQTLYLYAEMGNNSVVYPTLKLYQNFKNSTGDYIYQGATPYQINFIGKKDGKEYRLEWGGEWEVTMNTFRDLGVAMMVAILGIYFLLVGQFRSFKKAGIIMTTFLLGFFGVFPGFSLLYLLNNEYFSATAMIGVIALAGIVVGNAIILVGYIEELREQGKTLHSSIITASKLRLTPILLTSLTTVLGSMTILGDPVWLGLAWAIIFGLSVSVVLTVVIVPVFYYDSVEAEK